MLYTVIALQIASERAREADRQRLSHEARRAAFMTPTSPRPGLRRSLRSLAARPVRAMGRFAEVLADVACSAASHIEGVAG